MVEELLFEGQVKKVRLITRIRDVKGLYCFYKADETDECFCRTPEQEVFQFDSWTHLSRQIDFKEATWLFETVVNTLTTTLQ